MFSDEVLARIDASVLCWLATASGEGVPNVSPKEIFAATRDHDLVIANIASPKSARNIAGNAHVCVAFVDIFVQKGFQLFGTAELVKKTHPEFAQLAKPLLAMTQGKFPFATLFRVSVQEVRPIVAPRYQLFPETTEAEQIASALKAYGVAARPIRDQD